MAKKKKTTRRARKEQAGRPQPAAPVGSLNPVAPGPAAAPSQAPAKSIAAAPPSRIAELDVKSDRFLRSDLTRVGLLAALCLGLELGLWVLFKGSIGSTVYGWIKL